MFAMQTIPGLIPRKFGYRLSDAGKGRNPSIQDKLNWTNHLSQCKAAASHEPPEFILNLNEM